MQVTGNLLRREELEKQYSAKDVKGNIFKIYFLDEMDGNSWFCQFIGCKESEVGQVVLIENQDTTLMVVNGKWQTVIEVREWK